MMNTLELSSGVGAGQHNSRRDVVKVQTALLKAGLDVGAADGVCGPRVEKSIKAFQSRIGLTPDGTIRPGRRTDQELARRAQTSIWDTLSRVATQVGLFFSGDARGVSGPQPRIDDPEGKLPFVKERLQAKLRQFAKAFGAPVRVTSGKRTPAEQAKLMANMTEGQLNMYGGGKPDYIKRIKALGGPGQRSVEKVEAILTKATGMGYKVSDHLQGKAVDVSLAGWSDQQKARAKAIADGLGLRALDESGLGISCFHIGLG